MKLAVLTQATATSTTPRTVECKLSDLNIKRVDLNGINFLNKEKPLFLDLVYQDDSVQRVWCSGNVSKGIRELTIKEENYGVLVLVKAYTKADNAPYWQVQMPDGEAGTNTFSIEGSAIGNKPLERKKISWQELISLSNKKE